MSIGRVTAVVLTALVVVLGPAAPTTADGVGEHCLKFRGAERCAFWLIAGGTGADRVPSAATNVRVTNGDDAQVNVALMQRRTSTGWVTVARSSGSGVRGYYASDSVSKARCGDLRRGTYRSKGKVTWTSGGVRYTRWVTGTAVTKAQLC